MQNKIRNRIEVSFVIYIIEVLSLLDYY